MIRFFAEHPTASNLLMLVFFLAGLLTMPQIQRETFPEIKSYEIEIRIVYPGATPQDVETEICKRLEDALDGISFIDEKRCEARQSLGLMTIKMIEQGNFKKFQDDIKNAVDGIADFPSQADPAIVKEAGRIQNVVAVALTADLNVTELKTLAEQIKERMLQDPLIPIVKIQGFSKRQFQIQVPQFNLRRYHLSLTALANIIASQNLNLPLGQIETDYRNRQLRFNDEGLSIQDLAALVVVHGKHGNEIHLGEIATITDSFATKEERVFHNGVPAALLKIQKSTKDDSLRIFAAVQQFIAREKARLPDGVQFNLTQDFTSLIDDRIQLLKKNALQGLVLVFLVLWLFFGARYSFWVTMGLPVSFLASAFILGKLGISINMISLVALLLALGILMDDAIVISESVGSQIKQGKAPLEAAIAGTKQVSGGVLSSFITTLFVFIGLAFLEGDIGQILKVIPVVLISVIVVSLFEAFFILPNHLHHALIKEQNHKPSAFRRRFEKKFEYYRQHIDKLVLVLLQYRYFFIGSVLAFFIVSISLVSSGILKFAAFPNVEGDIVQAKIMLPAGTSLPATEKVIEVVLAALTHSNKYFSERESQQLVQSVTLNNNLNVDAFETGPHLATISVDLLTAERRHVSISEFIEFWRKQSGVIPEAHNIQFKEPAFGPAGRPIFIRLKGQDLENLSTASHTLQNWLAGYPGVVNLLDDLRPGIPEYTLHLKEGAYALGLDAKTIADQLRAGYQGVNVMTTSIGLEVYDVMVILAEQSRNNLENFNDFPIIHPQTHKAIPLSNVATIVPTRGYSRINRINNRRTVSIYADVDTRINNTEQIINALKKSFLPKFKSLYPDLEVSFEGEIKNGAITQNSMRSAFLMGITGIFILLSFQFRSYTEPLIVMIAIPLALIGVIWGHLIMGLNITMPSLLGFVSLAGIVVNDSILLVEAVKHKIKTGVALQLACANASHERFRAIILTSLTTIAGMTPLLFETSLQAQILIPLATSIVFGILASTLLVLFVIPCLYSILEDFGLTNTSTKT